VNRAALAVVSCLLASCDSKPAGGAHAAFGVFFGGQIQDRSELAYELDPMQERHGIRVDFDKELDRERVVSWEIAMPLGKQAHAPDAGSEQVVEVGEARARKGSSRLDVPLAFRPGQSLGRWHVRVRLDMQTLIDRDLVVFDPNARPAETGQR
jgi:hypothetical protein